MNNWKLILTNSTTTIVLIGIVSLFLIFRLSWKNNYQTITSDGIGYYSYLPYTFLNNTIDKQKPDKRFFNEINGKGVNKYYLGTAVAMYPFFELGCLFENKAKPITGFEAPYQRAISFAALFYLLGGLLFLRGLLRKLEFEELHISIALLLIFFGTNLLAYSVLFPSMSHIYSFFFISGFLFFVKKYPDNQGITSFLWGMFFLGMIILIRPLNGIVIFVVPFLIGSKNDCFNLLKSISKPVNLFPGIIILASVLFIQSYFWYLQCGEWIVWSYSGEGFYFAKPYFREFLFSFRKGAFIYTPILLLSIFGIITVFRRNKFQGWSILVFVLLLFYLLSSWWNWYYGPSFGQRPLVEFYPVFAILIAYLLKSISQFKVKIVLGIFSVFFVFLNLIQTYQYHKGIISWWDMNWSKYSYTFLKTNESYRDCLGGNNDILPYKPQIDTVFNQTFNPVSKQDNLEIGKTVWSPWDKKEVIDYSEKEFNFKVTLPVNKSFISKRGIYLIVNLNRKQLVSSNINSALFVIEISDSTGNNYHYGTFPVNEIPPTNIDKWIPQEYSIEIKEIRSSTDIIKIYIWNKEKQSFWIDGVEIKILAID